MEPELRLRLQKAGIDHDRLPAPGEAFAALHAVEGKRATLLDRYRLEELWRGIPIDTLTRQERSAIWLEILMLRDPETELTGTGISEPIEVVPYDTAWPQVFEEWQRKLADRLRPLAVTIEHIGSTAVPGLVAKPIVDILVTVEDVNNDAGYVGMIESLGVPLRSREHGHRYFRPAAGSSRTLQIHVCQAGSKWEHDHLAFRDILRADPALADAYGQLKLKLAERFRDDRMAYNDAKTGFILDALERL
jgi:GrpB-like predicted nucleotidyltransferase (UPF0157 family)